MVFSVANLPRLRDCVALGTIAVAIIVSWALRRNALKTPTVQFGELKRVGAPGHAPSASAGGDHGAPASPNPGGLAPIPFPAAPTLEKPPSFRESLVPDGEEPAPAKDRSTGAPLAPLPGVSAPAPAAHQRQPTRRRLESSSSVPSSGLGGWSPAEYLARFGRFQVVEQPSGRILAPNCKEGPIPFENDYFKGKMLILLRTSPADETYGAYFAGSARLFEMQIQGKFKQLPSATLYMGAELPVPVLKLGMVLSATVKMCMSFAKSRIADLHWGLGDRAAKAPPASGGGGGGGGCRLEDLDPSAEAPHMVMPL